MDSGVETVTEAELLNLAIDNRLIDLHVAMPARVESYDASKQTVTVTPMLNRALPDGDGGYVSERLPKLADVPVAFPRARGFGVTFPLSSGDYVLLVFAERNIGAWRATGNQGDPGDIGMHTLDGAVAIPGLYPDAHPASSASGTNMVIGKDDTADAQIEITPTGINLGAGATRGVARENDNLTATATMLTWAAAVETALSGLGSPVASPFASGPGIDGNFGTINGSSSKVKAV